MLVLLVRVGAGNLCVHLLRGERQGVRHRGAGRRVEGSAHRGLRDVWRLPEDARRALAVAVPAVVDLGYRNDGPRRGGDGEPLREAAIEELHQEGLNASEETAE